MLKNPEKPDDYLVRRLAAIEGYEMVSKDEKDESFVLEKDQCWVLSDNEALKAKACHIIIRTLISHKQKTYQKTDLFMPVLYTYEPFEFSLFLLV